MHHELIPFLCGLALLLGVARIAGEACKRLGFPAVVGEIIAGVTLGKTLGGRLFPGVYRFLFEDKVASELLTGYTTVSVVLLLVVAGIEMDLTVVRRSGRAVVMTSLLGAIIPFALGVLTAYFALPDSDLADPSRRGLHAVFFGIALSISALPVIARTLLDLGLMKTEIGLLIVSSAVVDDLMGWTAFSVLAREMVTGESGAGTVAMSAGLTLVFVAVTLAVVRPLTDRVLSAFHRRAEKTGGSASGKVLTFVMVIGFAGAAITQALGMHAVFGGFVMGLAAGDSKHLKEHARTMLKEFVTNVFTPVLFATMALRTDFAAAFDLRLVVLVLGIAFVAKVAGASLGARLGGARWREATAIGFGMNSRGAMEILLASLALEAKIITPKLFVALLVMAIVTSLVSGPALARLLRPLASPVARLLRAGAVLLDEDSPTREGVICALAAALAARSNGPDDAERFVRAALAREDLSSTGVGDQVAFPHAEVPELKRPLLGFAKTRAPVDFDAPDGLGVRLVFLLLVPPKQYDKQLLLLAMLARQMADPVVRAAMLAATTEADVLAALKPAVDPDPALLRDELPSQA